MPTTTYTTVGWNIFTVPTKVTSVTVTIDGAGAGARPGGRVSGKIAVSPGQKLYCSVGGAGKAHNGSTAGSSATGGGGAGGTGRTGQAGGNGGGGATFIRVGSTTGTLKAVAGGAGGDSGDTGAGGAGGSSLSGTGAGTGGSGGRGNAGTNETGAATGGTQSQGGNGGTSSAGSAYYGRNAADTVLPPGGAGGSATTTVKAHGGGGGGGGYHAGGGGQASAVGYAPGGGGGGGSSYVGGLSGAAATQGGGGTGNGSVVITWIDPTARNQPPNPPSDPKVNNVAATSGMLTKATTSVKVKATLRDPDAGEKMRLLARWSNTSTFSTKTDVYSGWYAERIVDGHEQGVEVEVTLTGLKPNTHYWVRLYNQDQHNAYSVGYNSIDFWTDKAPLAPTGLSINGQGEGMNMDTLTSSTFRWIHNDEDVADYQTGFEIKYRTSATSFVAAGPWTTVNKLVGQNLPPKVPGPPTSSANEWVFDPGTFKGNKFYEWTVRTRDSLGQWGAVSTLFTFHVSSTSSPPILLTPTNRNAVDVSKPTTFTWRFVDPDAGEHQVKADLRYRVVGATKDIHGQPLVQNDAATNWVTLAGLPAPGVPGAAQSWTLPEDTFIALYTYEWQVRTYDILGGPAADWSDSFWFYAITTPGSEGEPLPIASGAQIQGALGCGTYRVWLYEQGGQKRLGEVTPIAKLNFTRVRDDISSCTVISSGYSQDCGQLYAKARSWMHELVVFRDGVRVWEGPVTRIGYQTDQVEIEAKDVMAYVYRRVMRQGYNDAYRLVKKGTGGQPDQFLGLLSVVRRAAMLITQGLAPYDPNVLPYLTALEYPDDAKESRVVADWSRTVWEEVDDLAATAGLDYTTVGRRILLWDTHRAIGRLPEMRDGDFSEAPIVTEYGMQLANFFGVTNGSGVVGYTWQGLTTYPFGPIEMLASSYSDSAGASAELQTPEALAQATAALIEQAKRNIAHRWPSPLIVRIPDNSTLSPDANVGFQQLIPGVWLPLRSVNTPRKVTQWQKLDSIGVEVDDKGEKVHVVMSPAPNGGNDPDADLAAEAD